VLITIVYFFVANDNWSSVLTHMFGFSYGIVLSFVFVVLRLIKMPCNQIENTDMVG